MEGVAQDLSTRMVKIKCEIFHGCVLSFFAIQGSMSMISVQPPSRLMPSAAL